MNTRFNTFRHNKTSTAQIELTSTFLNEVSNRFGLIICHLEDIAEAIENHLNDLGVLHCQQVAEWRDHLLLNQVCHL